MPRSARGLRTASSATAASRWASDLGGERRCGRCWSSLMTLPWRLMIGDRHQFGAFLGGMATEDVIMRDHAEIAMAASAGCIGERPACWCWRMSQRSCARCARTADAADDDAAAVQDESERKAGRRRRWSTRARHSPRCAGTLPGRSSARRGRDLVHGIDAVMIREGITDHP